MKFSAVESLDGQISTLRLHLIFIINPSLLSSLQNLAPLWPLFLPPTAAVTPPSSRRNHHPQLAPPPYIHHHLVNTIIFNPSPSSPLLPLHPPYHRSIVTIFTRPQDHLATTNTSTATPQHPTTPSSSAAMVTLHSQPHRRRTPQPPPPSTSRHLRVPWV
nr:hypothetical protein [Tanacetum cinerariifolium]